ncbi:sensor histidine kinase [Acidimangrovimonas pyrenivorans]|uniref:histidine kinase n=1 Tax=Acidimangrovimonas pyrenivorans TaxID=2030798 RepID=A0ABV7ACR0_9RHOB
MRLRNLLIYLLLPIAGAVGLFMLSHGYFRSEELARAEGRLSLYRSTVVAELQRFSHLTYVLARDPYVIATAGGASAATLNRRLAAFSDKAGLDAIYVMRPDGETISASNAGTASSFIGHNYSFRPYFRDAVAGRQGRFYGIGSTTGQPGYFIADAVRDSGGRIIGVIAIKLGLSGLEQAWRAAGESVLLANSDGVVLLASEKAWRYRTLGPLDADQRRRIVAARQFAGQTLPALDWRPAADHAARIGGAEMIHVTASDLPHHWVLHYFASEEPAYTRSWLVTGAAVILAGAFVLVTQLRRTARIGAALRRSEAEEAGLRRANAQLAVEIEERRAAERRLQRTQDELARTGRLAALGELAASVTHELGQPIAAMSNHLAAAEMSGKAGPELIGRISGLVARMEGITRQLKFFARTEGAEIGEVDLRAAMRAALALVAPNIEAAGVALETEFPEAPVIVRGNQLRLEQVMTNLLRNAVDAMEDSAERRLGVTIGTEAGAGSGTGAGTGAGTGWFAVADRGHGLGDTSLADLQEPFVTSRESGRGMGLGLSISAAIVREHHGSMQAANRPGGGAVFRIAIPLAVAEDTAEETAA